MKTTPFTEKHIALGAKMAEFAGYNMPISYAGINEEHRTVRENAGVFDVSHMGEFLLEGEQALDLIQRVTTNDASKLTAGKAQYSCLTNEQGGIIDDLIVYCLEAGKKYMLVVNAANIEKDWNWIAAHNTAHTALQNISEQTCLLAIQGPNACKIVETLTNVDLQSLRYYTFAIGSFAGIDNVIVSATGYTGAGGIEIYFQNKENNADTIWNRLFETGAPHGLKPIGLGARDTLRLEMGYCLYGNDIDDTTSPLEAGLGWITKLKKTTPFTARDILQTQKEKGITRKLVGFELTERGIPRHGYEIADINGKIIGHVTSGTMAPSLGKAIGLGYVEIAYAAEETPIHIIIRNKPVKAKLVNFPFK